MNALEIADELDNWHEPYTLESKAADMLRQKQNEVNSLTDKLMLKDSMIKLLKRKLNES